MAFIQDSLAGLSTRPVLIFAADLLTVIVFLNGGRLVDYLEYPRDHGDFTGVVNPYTPETAIFEVEPSQTDSPRYILAQVP